jgi:transcriptional regulator with XRE-family HTH domain
MKEDKVEKFVYEGFGFPVILLDVPMKKIRGIAVPDINYNALQLILLDLLSHKPFPLTGDEIRFIRQSLKMTLVEFAKHFGVTHSAVIKWEKSKDQFAKITSSTELHIRLFTLEHLKVSNEKFRNTFVALDNNKKLKHHDQTRSANPKPFKIESSSVILK